MNAPPLQLSVLMMLNAPLPSMLPPSKEKLAAETELVMVRTVLVAPALLLNVPVALPPLLKRRLPVAAVAVPLLLKVRARVELPVPADLVSKPVLLKVELAPPLRVRSFWIVKLPELLMVEV